MQPQKQDKRRAQGARVWMFLATGAVLVGVGSVAASLGGSRDRATASVSPSTGGEAADTHGAPTPTIQARPIPRTPQAVRRGLLPKGARGAFPGFDGDSFFLALKPTQAATVSSASVAKKYVLPLIAALGGTKTIRVAVPRGNGTALPRANLSRLSQATCHEFISRKDEMDQEICAVMEGRAKPTPAVEKSFLLGEGMTFAQFKRDIERQAIEYVFPQLVGKVPIERTGVRAVRWEGETVTSVHGALFSRYAVVNKPLLSSGRAVTLAVPKLLRLKGMRSVRGKQEGSAALVLLPYGGVTRSGTLMPALRYAWRLLLRGTVVGGAPNRATWLSWLDAQTGAPLAFQPQFDAVSASGERWARDPTTSVVSQFFTVDPAASGQYVLSLSGVFNRFDRLGDGDFNDGEVTISDSSGGSSSTFANFNQSPINNAAAAVCASGGNNTFRQANAFAWLSLMYQMIQSGGTGPSFPEHPITVYVDTPGSGNFSGYDWFASGQSLLNYIDGSGFESSSCPNLAASGSAPPLNGAQDPTSMGHEFAHLSTARFQVRRPATWCGSPTCSMPNPDAASSFHDFADSFAHAYASINCQGGYSRKNLNTANGSLNCAVSDEDGGLPRLSQVTEPFDPVAPGDHFPEHRNVATGDYADGQIVAAAFWSVREGMRSKCLPSGTPQYFVRLIRALWAYGFTPTTCSNCDRDIYRFMQEMLRQMTNQWATSGQPGGPPAFFHNGAHSTNKVTSGFARAGVYLVPYQCVDGDTSTTDASSCPSGENGGDAIIDVHDNNAADDPTIEGIRHPEEDYLQRSGPAPTFGIWTGPRFQFDSAGSARTFAPTVSSPAPCYPQYQVEVSDSSTFSGTLVTSTPASGTWLTVSRVNDTRCYASWTPTAAQWADLRGTSGETRIYYRVRTRDAAGTAATERISTAPGNGLFTVPPAYAVVNDTGQP